MPSMCHRLLVTLINWKLKEDLAPLADFLGPSHHLLVTLTSWKQGHLWINEENGELESPLVGDTY